MVSIDNFDFQSKKVLIRVDFNVPLNDKLQIIDNTRMRAALPTIKKIVSGGGIAIIISHLGRPKNGPENKYSLKHLSHELGVLLDDHPVYFMNDCIGPDISGKLKSALPGTVYLLENLRFYKEEKMGNVSFAKSLASLADVYINDAFGTAHRAHASTATVAKFFSSEKKLFGYLMADEMKNINKVLSSKDKPVVAIIGGAKVSSKITILENLLEKVDYILIGGGMAFTLLKSQEANIGDSLFEPDFLDLANRIIEKGINSRAKIILPKDIISADKFDNEANTKLVKSNAIEDNWMGLDIGPETIQEYSNIISLSKVILWNGPMGVFELSKFEKGTKSIAYKVSEQTKNGAFSVVGGGDSVAAINKFGLSQQVSFVSTGGGAMLEYLEGKILPGIAAILD